MRVLANYTQETQLQHGDNRAEKRRNKENLGSPRQDLGWIYAMQKRIHWADLFLAETEASVEQFEILASVFTSAKKITQDLQLLK